MVGSPGAVPSCLLEEPQGSSACPAYPCFDQVTALLLLTGSPVSGPSPTTLWPWLTSSRDRASLSATVPIVRVRSGDWGPVRSHSRAPESLQGEALHGLTSFPHGLGTRAGYGLLLHRA